MKNDDSYSDFFSWLIPLEVIKLSPTYEILIKDAREHWQAEGGMRIMSEILGLMIAKRFPKLKVAQKIKRIRDVALLQQLCLESLDVKDTAEMRERLDEAIKSQTS